MAGRPRVVRCKQSYINHIDNNTFSGPMKMGTSPSIGVTRNYWYNYQTQCNKKADAVKKCYDNMVFLNINSASTQVSAGFKPTTNNGYTNNLDYSNNNASRIFKFEKRYKSYNTALTNAGIKIEEEIPTESEFDYSLYTYTEI